MKRFCDLPSDEGRLNFGPLDVAGSVARVPCLYMVGNMKGLFRGRRHDVRDATVGSESCKVRFKYLKSSATCSFMLCTSPTIFLPLLRHLSVFSLDISWASTPCMASCQKSQCFAVLHHRQNWKSRHIDTTPPEQRIQLLLEPPKADVILFFMSSRQLLDY